MEILGIGPLELLFILLIALIFVGPRDLGKAARSTGRLLNQLYKSEGWQNLAEASRNIRTLPNRLAREAALEELEQVKREMEGTVSAGFDEVKKLDPTSTPAADGSGYDSEDPSQDSKSESAASEKSPPETGK